MFALVCLLFCLICEFCLGCGDLCGVLFACFGVVVSMIVYIDVIVAFNCVLFAISFGLGFVLISGFGWFCLFIRVLLVVIILVVVCCLRVSF